MVPSTHENTRPSLLDPKFGDFLVKTINMLPPKDFLNLAATSKETRVVCYRSPKVSVELGLNMMLIVENKQIEMLFQYKGTNLTWDQVKEITNLPFRIVVLRLSSERSFVFGPILIAATRHYLDMMKVKSVRHMDMPEKGNWKDLIELIGVRILLTTLEKPVFLQDYKVEVVTSSYGSRMPTSDANKIMQMNLQKFSHLSSNVEEEYIMTTTIPKLTVYASLDETSIERIVKGWLSMKLLIDEWEIRIPSRPNLTLRTLFLRFPEIHAEHFTGPLPPLRPLVVTRDVPYKEHFFLLRDDDRILHVFPRSGFIVNLIEKKKSDDGLDILELIKAWEYPPDSSISAESL